MGLLTTKIKSVLDYYIDSSFHVSLCAICYVLVIYNQNYKTIEISDFIFTDLLFVFTATFCAYNFIKFYEFYLSKNRPFNNFNLFSITLSIIFFLIFLFYFFSYPFFKQIIVLICSLITFAYTIPIYKKYTLRTKPIIKIISISISWSILVVFVPFYEVFDFHYLIYYSVIIFLITVILMIPFEIRDAKSDENYTKNSINVYGLQVIKKIGYFILFLILAFVIIFEKLNNNFTSQTPLILTLILTAILIRKSTEKQFKYFSSLVVESVPIYWLFLDFLF